jgi:hypothetical protein
MPSASTRVHGRRSLRRRRACVSALPSHTAAPTASPLHKATSPGGAPEALGAVGAFQISPDTAAITSTVISDNSATARSTTGSATTQGAGLTNDGVLLLNNDRTEHHGGTVSAPTGTGQGGGIFSGVVFGQPPVEVALQPGTGARRRGRAAGACSAPVDRF